MTTSIGKIVEKDLRKQIFRKKVECDFNLNFKQIKNVEFSKEV